MSCSICSKKLGKQGYKLQCNICEDWFHKACVHVGEDEFKQVRAKKKTWACDQCAENEDSEASEESESGDTDDDNYGKSNTIGKVSPLAKGTKSKVTMEHLLEKINIVIQQNDRMIKRITATEKENKRLKKEMKELREEQERVRKDMQVIKMGKNTHDQQLLNRNVVISGLPIEKYDLEQLKKTVQKVGAKLSVAMDDEDVRCTKIGKDSGQRLRVEFVTEELKDRLMEAKRGKNLNTKDLGLEGDKHVYINHDLTAANQLLYKKAREVKKNLKYRYAWVSHGKVYLRKSDDSKIIRVKSEEFLNDLQERKN